MAFATPPNPNLTNSTLRPYEMCIMTRYELKTCWPRRVPMLAHGQATCSGCGTRGQYRCCDNCKYDMLGRETLPDAIIARLGSLDDKRTSVLRMPCLIASLVQGSTTWSDLGGVKSSALRNHNGNKVQSLNTLTYF